MTQVKSFSTGRVAHVPCWLMRVFMLTAILLTCTYVSSQTYNVKDHLSGYWKGEFMPGNNMQLIIEFNEDNQGTAKGRILLFQGDKCIQDDALENILLAHDQLFFHITNKETPFRGFIESGGNMLNGDFYFPDGSVHPVNLHKVTDRNSPELALVNSRNLTNILEKKFSPEQMKRDLGFLMKNLEEEHPRLYLYTPRECFERQYEKVIATLDHEMTVDEFYRHVAPLAALVNCCHTDVRLPGEYEEALDKASLYFPVDLRFINDYAYVIQNYSSNEDIQKGMRVLSINGTPVNKIRDVMLSSIPSDGYNLSRKEYLINTSFPYMYSLYIGYSPEYELEVVDNDSSYKNIKVQGMQRDLLRPAWSGDFSKGELLPVQLMISPDMQLAVMTIRTFSFMQPEKFTGFLENSFRDINEEGIQNLIIDLRGNQGGYPFFAAELLSYISHQEFRYFELPEEQGEFAALYQPIKPKGDAYKGNIYVLCNGGCTSTTAHFLSMVKYYKLGNLIGDEAGGSFSCNDNSIQMKLPETGIMLNLPRKTYQVAVKGYQPGEPMLPDYLVTPTKEDIIGGKDAEMNFTYRLISGEEQP